MALNKQRSNQFISTLDQQPHTQVVDRDEAVSELTQMIVMINQMFEFSNFEVVGDESVQKQFVDQYRDLSETRDGAIRLRNKLVESDKKQLTADQQAEMIARLKAIIKQTDKVRENVLVPLVRSDKQTYQQYSEAIEEV